MTSELIERVARVLAGPRADEMVLAGNPIGEPCEYPRWMLHQLDARAAIAAMQDDAAPVAWMPIETAPKDGTEIILWPGLRHPVDGVIPPAVGAWHKYRELECWDDLAVGHHNGYWKPTHWMPLPAAPVDDRVSTSSPVDDRETPKTSGKLRDAMEVWREAYDVWDDTDQKWLSEYKVHMDDKAAAAIIEQDREAVRAAERAQLRAELEAAGEVIAEQLEIRQRNEAELAKFKALAETLAGALGEAVTWNSHDDEGVPAVWLDQADVALREYKEARDAS